MIPRKLKIREENEADLWAEPALVLGVEGNKNEGDDIRCRYRDLPRLFPGLSDDGTDPLFAFQ